MTKEWWLLICKLRKQGLILQTPLYSTLWLSIADPPLKLSSPSLYVSFFVSGCILRETSSQNKIE